MSGRPELHEKGGSMTKQTLEKRVAVLEEALEQARQIIDGALIDDSWKGGDRHEAESLQTSS